MFLPIWPSSSVKILVLRKLLCSFALIWSHSRSPLYTLVYLSVMDGCPCATRVSHCDSWLAIDCYGLIMNTRIGASLQELYPSDGMKRSTTPLTSAVDPYMSYQLR
jgi:hypothetical protein